MPLAGAIALWHLDAGGREPSTESKRILKACTNVESFQEFRPDVPCLVGQPSDVLQRRLCVVEKRRPRYEGRKAKKFTAKRVTS